MKAYVIAGELSGDKLGGALMAGLKKLSPDISFKGVGGPLMHEQGLDSLFAMQELSVMGIAEIAPKYFHFKRRISEVAGDILAQRPDVLITIDSPDFCLRVAKKVKAASAIRTVHYVAPTVWAWRSGRAKKMAQVIDHVLALFPFEPALMQAAGMRADFVGHPVVAEPQATEEQAAAFRKAHGIAPDAPLLLVLPGSRKGEVARLSDNFAAALKTMAHRHPEMSFVLPAAAPVAAELAAQISMWPDNLLFLDLREPADQAQKPAAFKAADIALAASGTVSLELAAAKTPMVIAYDMHWISRQVVARMLKVDTVTLVNLVSETRSIPEYLGAACTPANIVTGLEQILLDSSAQQSAMAETMTRLGQGGEAPGLRAARAVLEGLAKT